MRKGLTEDEVQATLGELDAATPLPPSTVAALRLADRLTDVEPAVDAALYADDTLKRIVGAPAVKTLRDDLYR